MNTRVYDLSKLWFGEYKGVLSVKNCGLVNTRVYYLSKLWLGEYKGILSVKTVVW